MLCLHARVARLHWVLEHGLTCCGFLRLGPHCHCGVECSITAHLHLSVTFLHFCLRYDRRKGWPWCFCFILGEQSRCRGQLDLGPP